MVIHWMYGRCDRRLHKAVTAKDPFKVSQYQAGQGLLSDMLAFLETANGEENERMESMLHEIADLSSDEDSPTLNTGGHPPEPHRDWLQLSCMVLQLISCVDVTVEHLLIR